MSYMINNNAFEVNPTPRNKRKRNLECDNVYMNPALDLLSTEDAICNTTMEIVPAKRKCRSKSCDDRAFENPALDLGAYKKSIHGLLKKHLDNVNEKLTINSDIESHSSLSTIHESNDISISSHSHDNLKQNSTPNYPMRRSVSFDLSFIEKINVDENVNEELYFDDDLNESNIMEIKTITTLKFQKKPKIPNTNPFLDPNMSIEMIDSSTNGPLPPCNNFPFDLPLPENNDHTTESSYDATSDVSAAEIASKDSLEGITVFPRRLFVDDTCDVIEHSVLDSTTICNNVSYKNEKLNKQSQILGCDVTNMTQNEIFNPNLQMKKAFNTHPIECKDFAKSKNKKASKLLSKIKDVFIKNEKKSIKTNYGANPYEVVRPNKLQEINRQPQITCFENPALNLNFQEENVQRRPFNRLPMNYQTIYADKENVINPHVNVFNNSIDLSGVFQQSTNKKQVRFDSTLNCEKVITGSSFDSELPNSNCTNTTCCSRGLQQYETRDINDIDTEIDEYHNELENCFNERKMITQHIK